MAAPAGAALRLRLLFRMLRVGELLALAVLLSWSSTRAPSAAAAAVRAAGSLLFSPRFVFVLGNAIVLLLLALSKRQPQDPSLSSSSSSAGSQIPTPTAAPPAACFPSFPAPATTAEPVEVVVPTVPPPPAAKAAMATVFEVEVAKPVPVPAAEAEARRVVGNSSKARAPRRSRSEKMGRASRRAASPEMMTPAMLRRSESDNGRRRSSATARDVVGAEGRGWGKEDADEFRRTVEAFIARQTRFHREESSMAVLPGAGAGALVVVE